MWNAVIKCFKNVVMTLNKIKVVYKVSIQSHNPPLIFYLKHAIDFRPKF